MVTVRRVGGSMTLPRRPIDPGGKHSGSASPPSPNRVVCPSVLTSGHVLAGSRYDSTSDENCAYFRKPRLEFVVLVALDNGDPVIALSDRKLGGIGKCVVERRCDFIGPNEPCSELVCVQGAD